MPEDGARSAQTSLPPWLWFWLVVYAISLPGVLATWRQSLNNLVGGPDSAVQLAGGLPFLTKLAARLASVAEIVPSLALFLGILSIFLPWIRSRYLERRFRLEERPLISPALAEIGNFLREHAPGIAIKTNLLRTDQLALVYPLGYRKTAIGLFGGFVKLWRSDRQAAEAILLHEVAHYRNGDALIVGAGSLFEAVVRNLLFLYLIFLFVPQALAIASQRIAFVQESLAMGIPASSLAVATVTQLAIGLALILLQSVTLLFWTASIFVLPLLGIWWAEFNADRFAANARGATTGALIQALGKLSHPTSWWRWLLSRLSHPPYRMRRWMALRSGTTAGTVMLLLFFPLVAYLAKLLAISGWAITFYFGAGFQPGQVAKEMVNNIVYALGGYAPIWLAMGLLILAWPIAAGYWEGLFCRGCQRRLISGRLDYKAHVLGMAVVCILSASGYLLRTIAG